VCANQAKVRRLLALNEGHAQLSLTAANGQEMWGNRDAFVTGCLHAHSTPVTQQHLDQSAVSRSSGAFLCAALATPTL
jgi:hypothetical protein